MQYLIGEIGLSLLVAALIGLFIGWLIGRFRLSGEWLRKRRRMESDIYQREREIDRLREDFRRSRSSHRVQEGSDRDRLVPPAAGASQMSIAAGDPSPRDTERYAVARRDMRNEASVSVRDPSRSYVTKARDLRDSNDRSGGRMNARNGANHSPLRSPNTENRQQAQGPADVAAREHQLKQKLDDASFEKIQAFARLGELERNANNSDGMQVNNVTTAQLKDYQRLLDQKNQQVDQLQEKMRDLLALRATEKSADTEGAISATGNSSNANGDDRQRVLTASLEEESYAKVQALARVGELEQQLALTGRQATTTDNELIPLRRRTEQQEAIILDLRKKVELQNNQSEVMRQEYDRKLRSSHHELATIKADLSAQRTDNATQAEIDSYKRKLAESDRATQTQIKDFNSTLEARNREYDLLGKRLEDLRLQITRRDEQIAELKGQLDQSGKERLRIEAQGNRFKEELGTLQITLKEKDANIQSLTSRTQMLVRAGDDAKETEQQLAEFTRSTEQSTRRFEAVIEDHRVKLASAEGELETLRSQSKKREAQFEAQSVSLRNSLADSQTKFATLQAEANRFRTQQSASDTRITQLNKEIKQATSRHEHSQRTVKALETKTADFDKLSQSLTERQSEVGKLSRQLQRLRAELVEVKSNKEQMVREKEAELSKLKADLMSTREAHENEKRDVLRFKQEVDAQKNQVLQLNGRIEADAKKFQSNNTELVAVSRELKEQQQSYAKLQSDHELSLQKSADDLRSAQQKITSVEAKTAEQIGAKSQEIKSLKAETAKLQTLRADLGQRDTRIATLTTDLEKLRRQKNEYDNEIARLSKEVDLAKGQVSTLQESLDASNQTVATGQRELDNLKSAAEKERQQFNSLKKDHQLSTDKNAKAFSELQQRFDTAQKQADAAMADKSRQLEALQHKAVMLDELKQKTSGNNDEIRQLKSKLAEAEKTGQQRRDEISALRKASDEARVAAASEKETAEASKRKLSDVAAQVEPLRKQVRSYEQQITDLKKESDTRANGFLSKIQELEPWQQRFKESQQEVNDHKASIIQLRADSSAELERKVAEISRKNAELLTQRDKRISDLNSKVKALDKLKAEIASRDKTITDLNQAIAQAKKTAQESDQKLSRAEQAARSLEADISRVKNDYRAGSEQHHAEIAAREEQLEKLKNQMEGAASEHALKSAQAADTQASLQKELTALRQSSERELTSLKEKVKSLEPLQQQLSAREEAFRHLQQSNKQDAEKYTAQASTFERRIRELEPLQDKLATLEAENKQIIQKHKTQTDAASQELLTLQQRVRELEPLAQKLSALETENARLHQKNEASVEKAAAERSRLQAQVAELAPLQQKLTAKAAEAASLKEQQKTASEQSRADIQALERKVRELVPLQEQLAARESENQQLIATHRAAVDKSAVNVARLEARVSELEPLQQRLTALSAENEKLTVQQKSAADESSRHIQSLQSKVRELQESANADREQSSKEIASLQAQVRQIDPLQKQLANKDEQLSRAEKAQKVAADQSKAEISSLQASLKSVQQEAAGHKSQVVTLECEITGKQSEITTLKAAASKLPSVEKDLAAARQIKHSDDQELEQTKRKLKTLEESVARNHDDNERKLKALKVELSAAVAAAEKYRPLESKVTARENTIADLQAEIARLKARQQASPPSAPQTFAKSGVPAASASGTRTERRTADGKKTIRKDGLDDLKLIFGIGPKIEKMLNQQGVTRFEDIASWRQSDVDKYAEMLEGFSDRIERDEWVLSAQQLVDGTYNWEARRQARARVSSKPERVTADGKKTTRKDGMDDLKLIFGIGPKIEKMLNSNGVKRFEDIAAWKRADIDRFAEKLEGFSDRIERDEWVSSARQIIDGTYNWTERKEAREHRNAQEKA